MDNKENVRVSSHLELRGSLIFGLNAEGFPNNPKLGTMFFKEGRLYGYQQIGGLSTWYPLTQQTRSYIHTQGAPAVEWTVQHDMGSLYTWFQLQDLDGNPMFCEREVLDENSFKLIFTANCVGHCIVVAPESLSVPEVQASLLTATSVNIGAGRILMNSGGASMDGSPLLTEAALEAGAGVFATLVDGKVPAGQLPSYVDDVLEFESEAAFPAVGEVGKIYVAATVGTTGKIYRWTGSVYVEISATAGNSDTTTKLFTARSITLAGDLSGTASFDGSADITITATLKGDLVVSKTFNGPVAVNFTNEGSYVAGNVTGPTSISITGVPNDGRAYGITFELSNAGTNVTWPASVVWLGTAPTLRATGVSMVTLVTRNGGTTWYGSAA